MIEIELLAACLLERTSSATACGVRVTDKGITYLAGTANSNRKAFTAHEALVQQVARTMHHDGRLVWTNLELWAWVAAKNTEDDNAGQWKLCRPDVFSIRNSSKPHYLEPVVHEIKVSRADLMGDLKNPDKRAAYLDVGGQCWYPLGGSPQHLHAIDISQQYSAFQRYFLGLSNGFFLGVASQRAVENLPFGVWMSLVKASTQEFVGGPEDEAQAHLVSLDCESPIFGEHNSCHAFRTVRHCSIPP